MLNFIIVLTVFLWPLVLPQNVYKFGSFWILLWNSLYLHKDLQLGISIVTNQIATNVHVLPVPRLFSPVNSSRQLHWSYPLTWTLREGGTNNILVHDKRTIESRCILIHLQRYFAYFVLLCAQQRNQLQKTTVKVMFNLTKNMFIYIFMITPKWPDTFEID